MYTQFPTFVLRQADGAHIPLDPENSDFADFIAWKDEGGQPDTPPAPSLEDRASVLLAGVDAHLDAAARAKGYDNRNTFYMRAAVPGSPFYAEGLAFARWMDQVYAACYQLMAEVQAGDIEEPTLDQLIGMLPVLHLPE